MGKNNFNDQFRLELPQGWDDRTAHYFQGPTESGLQHGLSLVVDRDPSSTDLEEYAEVRVEQAVAVMPDAELIGQEQTDSPSGPVFKAAYRWRQPDGTSIVKKMWVLMIEKTGYVFSADFNKRTLKTLAVEAEDIVNSFQPQND